MAFVHYTGEARYTVTYRREIHFLGFSSERICYFLPADKMQK